MKKIVAIFLLSIMIVSLIACGDSSDATMAKDFEWSEIELSNRLPEPPRTYGYWSRNDEEGLTLTICEASEDAYDNYKSACQSKGFDIDKEETPTTYSAFDKDGYNISLTFNDYSQEVGITVDAPEEMAEFEWPTSGLGAMLSPTKSTFGDISWDNSETFIVHVGNTTIEEFKEYVKSCEEKGFTVDYSRTDEYYSAKNSNGYELTLRYLGFNRIEIALDAPEETESNTTSSNTGDIDPDFKAAMDEYESFIDDYVAFMKKFNANPNDLSLLSEYTRILGEYADFVESFNSWADEDLSDKELSYYLEVQTRVAKKMLEVTQ